VVHPIGWPLSRRVAALLASTPLLARPIGVQDTVSPPRMCADIPRDVAARALRDLLADPPGQHPAVAPAPRVTVLSWWLTKRRTARAWRNRAA
jgi:hypothetical protein